MVDTLSNPPLSIFSVNTVSKFVRHERTLSSLNLHWSVPKRAINTPEVETIARLQIECKTKLDTIKATDLFHCINAHTVSTRILFYLSCFEYGRVERVVTYIISICVRDVSKPNGYPRRDCSRCRGSEVCAIPPESVYEKCHCENPKIVRQSFFILPAETHLAQGRRNQN